MNHRLKLLRWLCIGWIVILLITLLEKAPAARALLPIATCVVLIYLVYCTVLLSKSKESDNQKQKTNKNTGTKYGKK
jgi:threonine/homoserine/homoserine lactone efflux protein